MNLHVILIGCRFYGNSSFTGEIVDMMKFSSRKEKFLYDVWKESPVWVLCGEAGAGSLPSEEEFTLLCGFAVTWQAEIFFFFFKKERE